MTTWGPYRISRTSKLVLISNPNYLLLRKKLEGVAGSRRMGSGDSQRGQSCLIRPLVAASLGNSGLAAARCHLIVGAALVRGPGRGGLPFQGGDSPPSTDQTGSGHPWRTWGTAEGHGRLGGPHPRDGTWLRPKPCPKTGRRNPGGVVCTGPWERQRDRRAKEHRKSRPIPNEPALLFWSLS